MRANRSSRIPSVLAGLCLAAALGSIAPGSAAPLIKYKCVGTIHYHGHPFQFFTATHWSWTFDSHGTCVAGVLQKVTYDVSGSPTPDCLPYYGTESRKVPGADYLAYTTITNNRSESLLFHHQWVGTDLLQINAWNPVPSRTIPIGGIVGLGIVSYGKPTGPWDDTTITGKVAFGFSSEEIPNTDQPDREAC
jgi:hypothetical protein